MFKRTQKPNTAIQESDHKITRCKVSSGFVESIQECNR